MNDSPDQPMPNPSRAAPEPIRFRGHATLSFRQVDEMGQAPKGTAFRGFKRLGADLVEGRDFFRLDAHGNAELIEKLRAEGRIYRSTVHLVLLTGSGVRLLLAGMAGH